MATQEVVLMGDPVLRQTAEQIDPEQIQKPKIQKLINDLVDTACANPEDGYITVGLAAPQINVSKRIFLVISPNSTKSKPKYDAYINPQIEYISREMLTTCESCLSTPNLCGDVSRCKTIRLTYLDKDGKKQREKFTGNRAIYVQHEYDHLEGILWIDKVTDTKTISYC